VPVGEGWGEGDFEYQRLSKRKIPLPLTISHAYVGEGTRVGAGKSFDSARGAC
jgi:hypothetical protein